MDLVDGLDQAREGASILEERHGGGGYTRHDHQNHEGEHIPQDPRGHAPIQVHGVPCRSGDAKVQILQVESERRNLLRAQHWISSSHAALRGCCTTAAKDNHYDEGASQAEAGVRTKSK